MLHSFSTQNTYISLDKALEFVGDNSQYQKRTIYFFFHSMVPFLFPLNGHAFPVILP